MLELQQRLLHADCTEQHKVGGAGLLRYLQCVQSSLVVNRPGVFLHACTKLCCSLVGTYIHVHVCWFFITANSGKEEDSGQSYSLMPIAYGRQASSVADFFNRSEPNACGSFLTECFHVASLLYRPDVF